MAGGVPFFFHRPGGWDGDDDNDEDEESDMEEDDMMAYFRCVMHSGYMR